MKSTHLFNQIALLWRAILGATVAISTLSAVRIAPAEAPPERLWLSPWNGPANHSDEAVAVLTLPDRSVLVAGSSFSPASGEQPVLLRYSDRGQLLWSTIESSFARPLSLHRTSTGAVLFCGYEFIDGQWHVFLRRLDVSDGSTVWQTARPVALGVGLFHPSVVEDVATQTVLVAAGRGGQALVLRLAMSDGELLGEQLLERSATGDDRATSIAPLPRGGFVVAVAQGGLLDGFRVVAIDGKGAVMWVDHENGQIGNAFTPAWLGLDPQGNVLVGAGMETTCGLFQFRAWKLSPAGVRLWTVDWPTDFCESANPSAFALAPDGSIAMVGQTHNPFDIAVFHVDPSGTTWVRTWDSPVGGIDSATVVECDAAGNVILGGFAAASPGRDLAILAFTSDGQDLFTRIESAGSSNTESIKGLSLGRDTAAGAIAITADGFTVTQNSDVYTGLYQRDLPSGDLDADGSVGSADLGLLLGAWGRCGSACPGDLNGDGIVDAADVALLLGHWS